MQKTLKTSLFSHQKKLPFFPSIIILPNVVTIKYVSDIPEERKKNITWCSEYTVYI